jgi:uncharacterized protein (TIGR03437 family)
VVVVGTALGQPPAITPGAIANAASLVPSSLPGGKLAPGARIVIAGVRFFDANSSTVVRFSQGEWSASVNPLSETATKIEAVVPPGTPLGEIGIAVVNGQGSSRPEKIQMAASSPGIVTLNGEGWGPAVREPIRSGQEVTLSVNGLNDLHPKAFVGGRQARVIKVRGQDLTFTIPTDAPAGCWTPVWIESPSGNLSNFVTLAIQDEKGVCQNLEGWFAHPLRAGTRNGLVAFERISGTIEAVPGKLQDFAFDSGSGFFYRASANPLPVQIMPPEDSCTAYTGTFTLQIAEWLNLHRFIGSIDKLLDDGPSLMIDDGDSRHVQLDADPDLHGFYAGVFGGTLPVVWTPSTPLFFRPGSYRIRSEGSAEIGKLDMTVGVPPPFEWVNRSDVNEIDRSTGVELEWRNLASDRQMVALFFNVDRETAAMGTAVCVAPPKATRMKVPPYALANFPATQPGGGLPFRLIMLASLPVSSGKQPVTDGLDEARAIFVDVQGKTVRFR